MMLNDCSQFCLSAGEDIKKGTHHQSAMQEQHNNPSKIEQHLSSFITLLVVTKICC
jgi:hypothetical protein